MLIFIGIMIFVYGLAGLGLLGYTAYLLYNINTALRTPMNFVFSPDALMRNSRLPAVGGFPKSDAPEGKPEGYGAHSYL